MLASDRGVVTAEFMLLMPALISVVALCGLLLSLGLGAIGLELEAAQAARQLGYGFEYDPGDYVLERWREQHLACVRLTAPGLIQLQAQQCVLAAGN